MSNFESDTQRAKFARGFIGNRLYGFRKDIRVCLTQDKRTGESAFFPALITCIAMLELLSGMYNGDLTHYHTLERILKFRKLFMDKRVYTPLLTKILYTVMRHKVAHLTHPYYVTDTRNERYLRDYKKQMRITWSISNGASQQAIQLIAEKGTVTRSPRPPWPVIYDHRLMIHLRTLSDDISNAADAYGTALSASKNKILRNRFEETMKFFYP